MQTDLSKVGVLEGVKCQSEERKSKELLLRKSGESNQVSSG